MSYPVCEFNAVTADLHAAGGDYLKTVILHFLGDAVPKIATWGGRAFSRERSLAHGIRYRYMECDPGAPPQVEEELLWR